MKIQLASTIRHYDMKNLPADLLTGVIIAAVSIPISMGYAQIAGLPVVYGLYGSVFPILLFALFSTSPQFIFGVDAAPAALIGSELLVMGIEGGTQTAMRAVPVLTFFVALWLLLFHFLKAGALVNYISAPVMGGFITGICTVIILMQIPKLMGGSAGVGELPELVYHLYKTIQDMSIPSFILGCITLVILLVAKKIAPKIPMVVILMAAGGIMTGCFPVKSWGIHTLSAVEPGLPAIIVPDFTVIPLADAITVSLSVAVVIMAETLLAENNFAQKNGYRINDNQEILAFSLGNFAAAFTGCCPMNGSVSRTAMGEQYQGKTQLTGVVAGITMILVLIFGTGFIQYLPVPVLTAIVISALIGATEFDLAHRLWKVSKKEFWIFMGAFFGVLMLGTINGVLIGMVLSFAEMIIRSAKPARCFLGIQPGHKHFRNIEGGRNVYPIKNVVIYRFSSSLFFANCDILQKDIEDSIQENTKAVILDASGIGSIDITAATRLENIYRSLKSRGIRFYITEHISGLNDQLRSLGLGYLIEAGAIRRTIHIALKDMGLNRPYPLEGTENVAELSAGRKRMDNKIHEFSWAFGSDAEMIVEKLILRRIENLKKTGEVENLFQGGWHYMEELDADEWLEHMKEHMREIARASGKDEKSLEDAFEEHMKKIKR